MDDSGTVTVIDAGTQEASDTTPADWVISLAGSGAYLRVNFLKTATATAIYCSAKVTLVEVGIALRGHPLPVHRHPYKKQGA